MPPQSLIPEDISTYGYKVDNLFNLILAITTVVLIGVLVLMVYFLVRYRHREGQRAKFSHGSKRLEVCWTLATAAILVFIAFVQKGAWSEIKQFLPREEESYLVRVFAEQFEWNFVYPGPDGQFEASKTQDIFPDSNPLGLADPAKDVVKKQLIVPVNTKVMIELNSLSKFDQNTQKETSAVIHSFFAPNLRLKQDILPYHPIKIWFEATKTGTYEMVCAELCGLGHYKMGAKLMVMTDAEVNAQLGYDWKAKHARFGSGPAQVQQPGQTEPPAQTQQNEGNK